MKIPDIKVIPIIAGTITISNFILSLIPVLTVPPKWYMETIGEMNNQLRFLTVVIFTLISSYGCVKGITITDKSKFSPSLKMTLVAISTVIFSWIVVFNLRVVALNDNLDSGSGILFFVGGWLFLFFLNAKLHQDFKSYNYPSYEGDIVGSLYDVVYFTPRYIRLIRFFAYWFTFIVGGYFVSIN